MSLLVKVLAALMLANLLAQETICEDGDVEAKQAEPRDPDLAKSHIYIIYDQSSSKDSSSNEDSSQTSSEYSDSNALEDWGSNSRPTEDQRRRPQQDSPHNPYTYNPYSPYNPYYPYNPYNPYNNMRPGQWG